jgi:hypothetical protein
VADRWRAGAVADRWRAGAVASAGAARAAAGPGRARGGRRAGRASSAAHRKPSVVAGAGRAGWPELRTAGGGDFRWGTAAAGGLR